MPPLPRVFAWLLYLLPAAFREEYGRDWIRQWRDEWRDASPARRRALFISAAWDTLRAAPREHASVWLRSAQTTARSLRRTPIWSLVAVVTLGLGGGALAAAFSVYNGVLLRPLPWRAPDRIAMLWAVTPQGQRTWLSAPEFDEIARDSRVLSDVAALTDVRLALAADGAPPRELQAAAVSSTFLPLLGHQPELGRGITADDDRRGAAPVAILSHSFWRERFAGDHAAVGRSMTLDGRVYQIVGVLPASFELLHTSTVWPDHIDVWVPLQPHLLSRDRTVRMLDVVGRLGDGVTFDDVARELAGYGAAARATAPLAYQASQGGAWTFTAVNLADDALSGARRSLTMIVGLGALVFLIACANVVNLTLARAEDRGVERATRIALGAGPARLRLETIVEAGWLAIGGTVVAVAIAFGSLSALRSIAPGSLPRLDGAGVDSRVGLAIVVVLSLMVLVIAAASLFQRPPNSIATVLPGRSGGVSRRSARATRAMLVMQTALATATVVIAVFLFQHVRTLQRTTPGIATDRVISGRLTLNAALAGTRGPTAAVEAAIAAVEQLPTVERAAAVSQLPLSGALLSTTFTTTDAGDARRIDADLRGVSERYLGDLGPAILRGRGFSAIDAAARLPVAVVDETFARRLRPDGDVIGRRVRWIRQPDVDVEIVGIAAPVRHRSLALPPRETVYRPIRQYPRWSVYLVARARAGGTIDAREVGAAVNAAVPGLPIADVATLDERLALSTRRERLMLALGGTLAAAALILAAVGVYGAVSHSVAKRRREFGVRLALGATPASVRRRIVSSGVALTSIGAAMGLAVAALAVQAIRATVVEGGSMDAQPFVLGVTAVVACAAAAAWIPARSASRTDAARSLRG